MSAAETVPPPVDDTDHESWAVGWLTVGLLLGSLGAFIGVYLVLRSSRWSRGWKLAALALPAGLAVAARIAPKDGTTSMFAWGFWIVALAVVVASAYVLDGAASRGSAQPRPSRLGAIVIAVLLVALASDQLDRMHPIGSYDFHDDVVAAAHGADSAGERYGVITDQSSLLGGGDEHTVAKVERLAGPGNARFVEIFDELEAKHGGLEISHLSPRQLGTCYVFPVVTSRREGIDSVTDLARLCTGPSEAGSQLRLSDR